VQIWNDYKSQPPPLCASKPAGSPARAATCCMTRALGDGRARLIAQSRPSAAPLTSTPAHISPHKRCAANMRVHDDRSWQCQFGRSGESAAPVCHRPRKRRDYGPRPMTATQPWWPRPRIGRGGKRGRLGIAATGGASIVGGPGHTRGAQVTPAQQDPAIGRWVTERPRTEPGKNGSCRGRLPSKMPLGGDEGGVIAGRNLRFQEETATRPPGYGCQRARGLPATVTAAAPARSEPPRPEGRTITPALTAATDRYSIDPDRSPACPR